MSNAKIMLPQELYETKLKNSSVIELENIRARILNEISNNNLSLPQVEHILRRLDSVIALKRACALFDN